VVAVAAVEVVAATLQAIGAGLTACGPGVLITITAINKRR